MKNLNLDLLDRLCEQLQVAPGEILTYEPTEKR
jgi:DNA-binding Xre family transcriptional regulator